MNKKEAMQHKETMHQKLNRLLKDNRGAGLTEYIILVGVVALLAVAAFNYFGGKVQQKVKDQGDTVENNINDNAENTMAP